MILHTAKKSAKKTKGAPSARDVVAAWRGAVRIV